MVNPQRLFMYVTENVFNTFCKVLNRFIDSLCEIKNNQMTVAKNSNPRLATKRPAIVSIKFSSVIARLPCLATIPSEMFLPDITITTTHVMVRAIPIETVIPNMMPNPTSSMDRANSMIITTPGHGIIPTTNADNKGP